MLLDKKVTKIVLSIVAVFFMALAALVGITGWDGTTPPAEALQKAIDKANEPQQPDSTPEPETRPEPLAVPEQPMVTSESPLPEENTMDDPSPRVYIAPAHLEAKSGQEISFNVEARFTDHGISGSEIQLKFDPGMMHLIGLSTDGVMGSKPLIGLEEVDNHAGMLYYALARRGATQNMASTEVLANIKFKIADSAVSGSYALTLAKVKLTDEEFEELTGFDIQGASVNIVR